jgi:hypothetical protein
MSMTSIDPRLTKTNQPRTNGHVGRMNPTLKEAMVKRDDDETHEHLKAHLHAFLMADNFAKRLKTLKGQTPYEYMCKGWQREPECFTINPSHYTLRLNP